MKQVMYYAIGQTGVTWVTVKWFENNLEQGCSISINLFVICAYFVFSFQIVSAFNVNSIAF